MNLDSHVSGAPVRQIEVDCHAPLQLGDLVLTEGDIPRPATESLAISEYASSPGGWAFGHTSIAVTTNKLRIAAPQLGRILTYEFTVPTPYEVVANAVRYIYKPHDAAGKGAQNWTTDLLTGTGTVFEIALLNAIARLGIVVLFGGQVTSPDGQVSGTATPGFDLLALDYRNQRAVAVSAKGTPKLPSREQLEALRQAVAGLRLLLPKWHAFGLVVCHAPAGDFASWTRPSDISVWGQEELGWLLQASTAHAIAGRLFVPPWASQQERSLYGAMQ